MKSIATLTITNANGMSLAAREAMADWFMAIAVKLINGDKFPRVFRRGYLSERKPKRKS